MNVVVLKGGPSTEREISLKSGAAVAEALRQAGHQVTEIDCVGRELPPFPSGTEVVFPVLHGEWGEDGEVQTLLEARRLPYVGCGVECSRLTINKHATCRQLAAKGIDTARSWLLTSRQQPMPPDLSYPLIVKPNSQGSTVGLTLVKESAQLTAALDKAFAVDPAVMLEDFVKGTEVTVGLLDGKALTVVEIIPPGELFDFDAKYTYAQGQTQYNCPPTRVPAAVQARMQRIAEETYAILGARDLLRVDMIWRAEDDRIIVLEGNTMPGFTSSSLLPKAAKQAGIDFQSLCCLLVERARHR
ncbi:MAG: UDP-N-acetylenolpyruvoylglucosamine reductase [Verrucomicrobiota bacterium]|jgi:D-alanine-D-alanine ligase